MNKLVASRLKNLQLDQLTFSIKTVKTKSCCELDHQEADEGSDLRLDNLFSFKAFLLLEIIAEINDLNNSKQFFLAVLSTCFNVMTLFIMLI